jgi:hypothetical protein
MSIKRTLASPVEELRDRTVECGAARPVWSASRPQ